MSGPVTKAACMGFSQHSHHIPAAKVYLVSHGNGMYGHIHLADVCSLCPSFGQSSQTTFSKEYSSTCDESCVYCFQYAALQPALYQFALHRRLCSVLPHSMQQFGNDRRVLTANRPFCKLLPQYLPATCKLACWYSFSRRMALLLRPLFGFE